MAHAQASVTLHIETEVEDEWPGTFEAVSFAGAA